MSFPNFPVYAFQGERNTTKRTIQIASHNKCVINQECEAENTQIEEEENGMPVVAEKSLYMSRIRVYCTHGMFT